MMYHDLQELIQNSRSSREYFLSLPVKTQCRLHDYHEHVHSAQELHRAARAVSAAGTRGAEQRPFFLGKRENPRRSKISAGGRCFSGKDAYL